MAILLVVECHLCLYSRFYQSHWANFGAFGVDLFFVISGYIITSRFIDERGGVQLPRFYIRRAFRILPVVVVYLAVVCLLSLIVNLQGPRIPEVWASLFFFRNYQWSHEMGGVYTMQFWSLSVEEHFYLLWPVLFARLGNKKALGVAVIGALVCAVWRIYCVRVGVAGLGTLQQEAQFWRTDLRFDGLLWGCALAVLLSYEKVRAFMRKSFPAELPVVLGVLVFFNAARTNMMPSCSTYLLLTFMLGVSLVVREGLMHKLLTTRVMTQIGLLSFSIYVWQEVFLVRPDPFMQPLGKFNLFPFNIVATFTAAVLSYYLVERPFIGIGRRLSSSAIHCVERG